MEQDDQNDMPEAERANTVTELRAQLDSLKMQLSEEWRRRAAEPLVTAELATALDSLIRSIGEAPQMIAIHRARLAAATAEAKPAIVEQLASCHRDLQTKKQQLQALLDGVVQAVSSYPSLRVFDCDQSPVLQAAGVESPVLQAAGSQSPKSLDVTSIQDAATKVSDIKVVGDGDAWTLLCKASSESQGWMKSTKAMPAGAGVLVQVTTQQRNPDGSYAIAEAVTYVPNVEVVVDVNDGAKLS